MALPWKRWSVRGLITYYQEWISGRLLKPKFHLERQILLWEIMLSQYFCGLIKDRNWYCFCGVFWWSGHFCVTQIAQYVLSFSSGELNNQFGSKIKYAVFFSSFSYWYMFTSMVLPQLIRGILLWLSWNILMIAYSDMCSRTSWCKSADRLWTRKLLVVATREFMIGYWVK